MTTLAGANAGRQMTTPSKMRVGVPDGGGDAGDEGGRGCNIVEEGVSGDRWRGKVSEPSHGAAEVTVTSGSGVGTDSPNDSNHNIDLLTATHPHIHTRTHTHTIRTDHSRCSPTPG